MRLDVLMAVIALSPALLAQPSFRSSVDVVRVTATVVDKQGKFVAGLTQQDFRILDGGVEQPIVVFSAEPQPVSVAFLIDISGSMEGQPFEQVRHAVDLFARHHLSARDEVFACVFNTVTTCAKEWTRDPSVLAQAVAAIEPRGSTQLYDAFEPALARFREAKNPKQVLVMLSDGNDMRSVRSLPQVHDMLRRAEVLTYAIAFDFGWLDAPLKGGVPAMRGVDRLQLLTAATGGRTIRAVTPAAIPRGVEEIANELGRQYQLGYHLPRRADGKYHPIKVEVKTRDVEVRARRGYLARLPEKQ